MSRPETVVAVVGATGLVGKTMLRVLLEREFPATEIRALASARSADAKLEVDGHSFAVAEARAEAFEGVTIALFSAGADISRELAPLAAARGAVVIQRTGATERNLFHLGSRVFHPPGADAVRIRFAAGSPAASVTIEDGPLVVTARRV